MDRDVSENMVAPDATIIDTLKIIDSHGVPIGLVHDNGVLVGTVTDGDIRRGILAGITLSDCVSKVMNRDPVTAAAETSDADATRQMRRAGIGHLPLLDGDRRIVGLKVLKDLDPKPDRANPVVLMAGGRGTRLHPLTEDLPKPMIEVGGRPILESILERFVGQGFTDFFISVNYKAELIEEYFGDGSAYGATVTYVREDEAMGTGGALSLLPARPVHPFIVMNGDVLTKVNFHHLLKFHENHAAPATMSVREYRFTVPFGVVETDSTILNSIAEKPEHTFFVNAGIYVLDPGVLDLLAPGVATDMPDLFQKLLDDGQRPTVFPLREYWMDIGRLDDLDRAKRDYSDQFSDILATDKDD
jgi:dTDP-glucose pyrophosphorylase